MASRKPSHRRTSRTRRTRGSTLLRSKIVLVVLAIVFVVIALDRTGLLPSGMRASLQTVEREMTGTNRILPPASDRTARPVPAPTADIQVDVMAVRRALETIRVEPEHRRGYRREDWPHWLLSEGCLNIRDQVLISESREPATLSADGCAVMSGLWYDAYTGQELRDPKRIDIDHMVPLEEAHQSGGYAWDRARRAAFANDLLDPRTLRAVSATVNRAKGAKGPEEWRPPNQAFLCRYVGDWVLIKARWRLTMDESERVAVGNMVAACMQAAELPASEPP